MTDQGESLPNGYPNAQPSRGHLPDLALFARMRFHYVHDAQRYWVHDVNFVAVCRP